MGKPLAAAEGLGLFLLEDVPPEQNGPGQGMPPQAFVGALNVYWAGSLDRSADATGYVRATPVACSFQAQKPPNPPPWGR